MKRLLFTLITALAFAAILASSAVANGKDLIISFWCAPPTTEPFDERYAEVAEANFTVVMNTCTSPTVQSNLEMLDTCRKYGMKAIVIDNRIMAKEPNDPDFQKNLDAVVADYSKHPAFLAYYLKDEPSSWLFPKLAAINQYLMKKDPAHFCYANLLPIGCPVKWYGKDYKSYEDYVESYLNTVKPKLLSFDHYVLLNNNTEIGNYFENLEVIRDAAKRHNIPWVNIFLLIQHFNYRDASESDLRWQAFTTLTYGGIGILYFTYWTPSASGFPSDAVITKSGKRTLHYEQCKRINREVKALGPTLLTLSSTGVFHTGTIPQGTKPLPDGTEIRSVAGEELVIGFFDGPNKSRWVMLTNRNIRKVKDATVTFDRKVKNIKEVDKVTGKLRSTDASRQDDLTVLKLKLKPGEGRLFRLDVP